MRHEARERAEGAAGTAGTDGVPGYTPPRRPGHVHRSHPLQDLLVLLVFDLLRLLHHHAPFRAPPASRKGAAPRPRSGSRESNQRAPSNSARPKIKAPRQTVRRAHVPEKHRRQRATHPCGEVLANRNVPNGAEPILKVIGLPPGIPDAALHEMPDQLRSAHRGPGDRAAGVARFPLAACHRNAWRRRVDINLDVHQLRRCRSSRADCLHASSQMLSGGPSS
jgi:hypothetical protein